MKIKLEFPTTEHKQAALEYRQEYIDFGETHIHGSAMFFQVEDYDEWLERIIAGQTIAPLGFVTGESYFAIYEEKIIGTVSIRHTLNEPLIKNGGILENEYIEENGNIVLRYWITLNKT